MEGASPLAGLVERLDLFGRLGMRVLGLTHNHDNECGDGCFAREPKGLTPAGRTLAREAEARGIILDAAHLNPVSFDQVLELGGRAGRLLAWRIARARRRAAEPDRRPGSRDRRERGSPRRGFLSRARRRNGAAGDLDDVVAHVEHWAGLVGPEHVGFGGDFDGIPSTLAGVETAAVYPALLAALAARGFSPAGPRADRMAELARVLRSRMPSGLARAAGA